MSENYGQILISQQIVWNSRKKLFVRHKPAFTTISHMLLAIRQNNRRWYFQLTR